MHNIELECVSCGFVVRMQHELDSERYSIDSCPCCSSTDIETVEIEND